MHECFCPACQCTEYGIHVAPVRQVKDSEQEVATEPPQKEGVISPKDTAMSIGSVKAEQLSSKVILTCESCSYKTSQHRPSKARQKLAAHMTGHSNVQKEPTGPTDVQEGPQWSCGRGG